MLKLLTTALFILTKVTKQVSVIVSINPLRA